MIHDKFTKKKGISKQYRWQLRKKAAGLCVTCGKPAEGTHCDEHKRKAAERRKKNE